MLPLLGQFDQFLEGIAVVFNGIFNALRHLIWHVGAYYTGKLQHVRIHQIPTLPLRVHRRRRLYRRVAVYAIGPNQRLEATRGLLVRRNRSFSPRVYQCVVDPPAARTFSTLSEMVSVSCITSWLSLVYSSISRRMRSPSVRSFSRSR
jgi:hypothetical protein